MMRLISFLLSTLLAFGLLFIPAIRGGELQGSEHPRIMMLLVFICLGFIHGIGFHFKRSCANWLISPWFVWSGMLAVVGLLVLG